MRRRRVIPPPLLFLACLAAGIVAQRGRPWPSAPLYPFAAGLAAGVVFLACAALLAGSALIAMHRAHTPVMPGHDPRHLVTRGAFRISRNPIYLALVLIVAAFALMLSSAWIALAAALLALLLDRLVIAGEEHAIAHTFPDEYTQYCKRVRRWL